MPDDDAGITNGMVNPVGQAVEDWLQNTVNGIVSTFKEVVDFLTGKSTSQQSWQALIEACTKLQMAAGEGKSVAALARQLGDPGGIAEKLDTFSERLLKTAGALQAVAIDMRDCSNHLSKDVKLLSEAIRDIQTYESPFGKGLGGIPSLFRA